MIYFTVARASLVVVAGCLALSGCEGPSPDATRPASLAVWRDVGAPNARCTVAFPTIAKDDSKGPDEVILSAAFDGIQYGLVSSRTPLLGSIKKLDSKRILQSCCNAQAKNIKAQVVWSEEIDLAGHRGLAATLQPADGRSETRVRWYVTGDRILCLSVAGPKGALNNDNAGQFFSSLRLTEPPSSSPGRATTAKKGQPAGAAPSRPRTDQAASPGDSTNTNP